MMKLLAFLIRDEETAADVIEKYQLLRFDDPLKLIEACDAIDVVAPTSYHFDICKAAILKGKHIFVEKPLANTMDEARRLVKLVKEANIKLQVGHVERFNPAFFGIKKIFT